MESVTRHSKSERSRFQFLAAPILLITLTFPCALAVQPPETTLYVNQYFEVRDHDQPIKYVLSGDTRIARITGSLSTNTRLQRLRLHGGWNLLSLAVTATNALRQMTNFQFSIFSSQSAFRWDPPAQTWLPVPPDDTLPAGTVLWLHAATNTTLALTGTYNDPTNRPVATGGSFLPGAGLEAWNILSTLNAQPSTAAWHFDSSSKDWQIHLPSIPGSDPGFPEFLEPGRAIYVKTDAPADLEIPDPALRIRYYHRDHLGSSSVMTDARGALVEETAFYPFGVARNGHRPRPIEEHYGFTQKERDRESGLHYFEARFLAGTIARFISADPKYARLDGLSADDLASFLLNPQAINLYAYTRNNPLKYVDPTGLETDWSEVGRITAEAAEKHVKGGSVPSLSDPQIGNAVLKAPFDLVNAFFGCSPANAPDRGAREYDRPSEWELTKNAVLAVGGGKLLNWAVGRYLAGPSMSAKPAIDPLGDTLPGSGPTGTAPVAAGTSGPRFARAQTLPGVTPFRQSGVNPLTKSGGMLKENWVGASNRLAIGTKNALEKVGRSAKEVTNPIFEMAEKIFGRDILPGD